MPVDPDGEILRRLSYHFAPKPTELEEAVHALPEWAKQVMARMCLAGYRFIKDTNAVRWRCIWRKDDDALKWRESTTLLTLINRMQSEFGSF